MNQIQKNYEINKLIEAMNNIDILTFEEKTDTNENLIKCSEGENEENIFEQLKINNNTEIIKNDSDEKIKNDAIEDIIMEDNINEINNSINEENKVIINNDHSFENYKDDIEELLIGNSYLNNLSAESYSDNYYQLPLIERIKKEHQKKIIKKL